MLTHIPSSSMTWAVYEYSRKLFYRARSSDGEYGEGSHVVNFAAGLLGGAVGGAVSTPFDVVRVRKQADGHRATLHTDTGATANSFQDCRHYRGNSLSVMRLIVAEHGLRGLARGLVPRVLFSAPQAALALVVYEVVKNLAAVSV